jgi:hypothetical protein
VRQWAEYDSTFDLNWWERRRNGNSLKSVPADAWELMAELETAQPLESKRGPEWKFLARVCRYMMNEVRPICNPEYRVPTFVVLHSPVLDHHLMGAKQAFYSDDSDCVTDSCDIQLSGRKPKLLRHAVVIREEAAEDMKRATRHFIELLLRQMQPEYTYDQVTTFAFTLCCFMFKDENWRAFRDFPSMADSPLLKAVLTFRAKRGGSY